MALTAYIADTNRLLQNPLPTPPLYSTADLTTWINEGRRQLAGQTQCIRASSVATLVTGQQIYSFSLFTTFPTDTVASGTVVWNVNPSINDTVTLNGVTYTFIAGSTAGTNVHIDATTATTIGQNLLGLLQASGNPLITVANYATSGGPDVTTLHITYKTAGAAGNAYTLAASAATPSGATLTGGTSNIAGISSVLTIRQLSLLIGSNYKMMINRPWPWFNRYYLSKGSAIAAGVPSTWSQLGLGTAGTFGISPVGLIDRTVKADVVGLPVNLTDDSTAEAIPYPFTDAIPYYGAYRAYLASQKTEDANVMFRRFNEYATRGVQITAPTVLPDDYQGGVGAQRTGAKQGLTERPQQGGK